MIRRDFLKRMALAAAACAFIDVPWPSVRQGRRAVIEREDSPGAWTPVGEVYLNILKDANVAHDAITIRLAFAG